MRVKASRRVSGRLNDALCSVYIVVYETTIDTSMKQFVY